MPFEVGYALGRNKLVLPLAAYPGVESLPFLGDTKYLGSLEAALAFFRSAAWQRLADEAGRLAPIRSTTLLEAAHATGLLDIEDRMNSKNQLPPQVYYQQARREIAMSSISAFRTFDQDVENVHAALAAGVAFRLMLLAPDSADVAHLDQLHRLPIRSHIEMTVERIRRLRLIDNDLFSVRFFDKLPPFTGVMIDGDVTAPSEPNDLGGQIRVQPGTSHQTQHRAIVLQFSKLPTGGGFALFAADLRDQWQRDVRPRPEFGV